MGLINAMMAILKMFKSKTITFNALAAIVAIINVKYNIMIPDGVIEGVVVVGNFILRLITHESISDKVK